MEEVWEDVKDYEGLYQVSSLGRVKSVGRYVPHKLKGLQFTPEKLRKLHVGTSGYMSVGLFKNNIGKTNRVHKLVWDAFGDKDSNSKTLHVDHIDGNKLNNSVENLQLLSPRDNLSKARRQTASKTSRFTGVSWSKERNKWLASIKVFGQSKNLGYYDTEEEANDNYLFIKKNIVEVCFG